MRSNVDATPQFHSRSQSRDWVSSSTTRLSATKSSRKQKVLTSPSGCPFLSKRSSLALRQPQHSNPRWLTTTTNTKTCSCLEKTSTKFIFAHHQLLHSLFPLKRPISSSQLKSQHNYRRLKKTKAITTRCPCQILLVQTHRQTTNSTRNVSWPNSKRTA